MSSNITAKMVAELRELTGLGMMDCKKALVEAFGDIKKAEEIIRIKSGAKASKMASRTAAEGIITSFIQGNKGILVEINCETDFVAKDENFIKFANRIAKALIDKESIDSLILDNNQMLDEARQEIVAKLGENITVRRFKNFTTTGHLATYVHGKKIGVMVNISGGDEALGKDIAMHIAANKPICVAKDNVPQDKIEQERNIYSKQAEQSGKNADIIAKMVEGRINKYLAEVTLLGQNFVKNQDITVEKLLAQNGAKVIDFAMFVVGEGIEKKTVDYAQEVRDASIVNK